jgi:hypothetical protein
MKLIHKGVVGTVALMLGAVPAFAVAATPSHPGGPPSSVTTGPALGPDYWAAVDDAS